MHWLVVGGGPSARETIKRVQPDKIIGSNRCLEFVRPDVYFVADPNAIRRYEHLWREYDGEFILGASGKVAFAYHERLDAEGRKHTYWPYRNAPLIFGKSCSGLLACQIALQRGASGLTLIGFDGHKPDDIWNDANDIPAGAYGEENCNRRNGDMERAFRVMAEKNKNVYFSHEGKCILNTPVDLPNWSHSD